MRVVVLEFIDEAKTILEKLGKGFLLSEETLVICFHPEVRFFLEENGIKAEDTIKYFDNEAQHRIILKTEEILDRLSPYLQYVDSLGVKFSYEETLIYYVRFYLNHFFWIIEVLEGVRRKHPVVDLFCCMPKRRLRMYSKAGLIQNDERFLGFLAKDFASRYHIRFSSFVLKSKQLKFFQSIFMNLIHFIGSVFGIIDYLFFILNHPAKKKIVVVPAFSYHMDSILKEMRDRHPDISPVMVWEGRGNFKQELFKIYLIFKKYTSKQEKEGLFDAIISLDFIKPIFAIKRKDRVLLEKRLDALLSVIQKDNTGLFEYSGISFREYLIEKMNLGLREDMLSLQYSSQVLMSVFKEIRPKLLMSMYSGGIYNVMGELSSLLSFPSLSISHGTHVPPNNEFEKIENYRLGKGVILNTYSNVAAQTPWTDKFLDYYQDSRPRLLSGPLLYSRKEQEAKGKIRCEELGLDDSSNVIVYASTQKDRYSLRFHIEETLDEYISTLIDLVNAVNTREDLYLVLRPHPACSISKDAFLKLLPSSNRLKIMHGGAFSRVLSVADLLVSYSSTCIEEALQSNIPVILYDKWKRYNHFNVEETANINEITRKPVYYITSPQVLVQGIGKLTDLFRGKLLEDNELEFFKFPGEYRNNFVSFVDETLRKEGRL